MSDFLKKIIILIFAVISSNASAADSDQLIIFVQPDISEVDTHFQKQILPQIKDMAQQMNIKMSIVNIQKNAPPELAVTPLIVFQNYRGRSIYQGRTNTLGRMKNFIRTSRFVPQADVKQVRENILIRPIGRAKIWSPVKIAPLTGAIPERYDHKKFASDARSAVEKGMSRFHTKKKARLGRADRGFYMDFYPWLSKDGTFYLSLALYSQFHCKSPVFEQKLLGTWAQKNKLFEQAGKIMEQAVEDQIQNPDGGDGFDAVSDKIKNVSWAKLGFDLEQIPQKSKNTKIYTDVPKNWILDKLDKNDPPMVQFRFPAPLDYYAGEALEGRADISLPKNSMAEGINGFFEIDAASITMGEPDLDNAIQGSIFLAAKKYPVSRFIITSASGDSQPIGYGRLSPVSFKGMFTLKGKTVPLTPIMEIEPVLNADGLPRLLVRGTFQIHLDEFNIEGADGPSPENKTLIFDLSFYFRPQ